MGLDSLRHYRLIPKGFSKAILTLCRWWRGICISCQENIIYKDLKWGAAWSLKVGTFPSWLKLTSSWHCEWWVQRGSSLHDLWPDALQMHGYVPPGWLWLLYYYWCCSYWHQTLGPPRATQSCVYSVLCTIPHRSLVIIFYKKRPSSSPVAVRCFQCCGNHTVGKHLLGSLFQRCHSGVSGYF